MKNLEEKIEAGYEKSRMVLGSLERRDAPLPSIGSTVRSVREGLREEHVAFMERDIISPLEFRIKPVASVARLRRLVDAQPVIMNIPDGQTQQDMLIHPDVAGPLNFNQGESKDRITGYMWAFIQSQQILNSFPGDDVRKTLAERETAFKSHLPKGARGTDFSTWAIMSAESLMVGKPLDCNFPNNATNIREPEVWNFTILDEEGRWTSDDSHEVQCNVAGAFDVDRRRFYLDSCYPAGPFELARFRASISGEIQS